MFGGMGLGQTGQVSISVMNPETVKSVKFLQAVDFSGGLAGVILCGEVRFTDEWTTSEYEWFEKHLLTLKSSTRLL